MNSVREMREPRRGIVLAHRGRVCVSWEAEINTQPSRPGPARSGRAQPSRPQPAPGRDQPLLGPSRPVGWWRCCGWACGQDPSAAAAAPNASAAESPGKVVGAGRDHDS
jgi:hypothetical protein